MLAVCFQRAAQTRVRMMARVGGSCPPARRCVTADMATAGPTVALVSGGTALSRLRVGGR